MNIGGHDYRQPKGHATSGTHRVRSPRDTFAEYSHHMQAMGITRLANITGLDRVGIPVYVAIRPNSRSLATSQGKGVDKDHARVSAMMESAENWHAEHIQLPSRVESYWKLSERERVIDIFEIPLRPGAPLRPEVPMIWLEGYDLLSRETVWVPYECITMNTVVKLAMALTFYTSSNGLASGNHMLEAANHALFEIIERDSHADWLDLPEEVRRTTKVDPASIVDPECRVMLQRFEAAGLKIAIWDITSPVFGIPVYLAQVVNREDEDSLWRRVGVCSGRGCHLAPVVALSRALSEAAQSRLTIISGSRDDNLPEVYQTQTSELLFNWMCQCFDPPPVLRFGGRKDLATDSFEGDLEEILSALRRKGRTQAAIVDLTQAGVGIPVVKAVVPGLAIADENGRRVAEPSSRTRGEQ